MARCMKRHIYLTYWESKADYYSCSFYALREEIYKSRSNYNFMVRMITLNQAAIWMELH